MKRKPRGGNSQTMRVAFGGTLVRSAPLDGLEFHQKASPFPWPVICFPRPMATPIPRRVELAHCNGTGSGEFFRRSLADALRNRTAWVDVCIANNPNGRRTCDFTFLRDGNETEILRVQVATSGFPDSVEIWLLSQTPSLQSQHPNTRDLQQWVERTVEFPQSITIAGVSTAVVLRSKENSVTLFPRTVPLAPETGIR